MFAPDAREQEEQGYKIDPKRLKLIRWGGMGGKKTLLAHNVWNELVILHI